MSLKLSTNNKGEVRLTWISDDTEMEAAWKFRTDDGEEEILVKLEKACRFIRTQRGEKAAAIQEVEDFLDRDSEGDLAKYDRFIKHDVPPPGAERIKMGPPDSSGRPAGGPPPTNGWALMSRTAEAPALPAHSQEAGWEMIPPGEM